MPVFSKRRCHYSKCIALEVAKTTTDCRRFITSDCRLISSLLINTCCSVECSRELKDVRAIKLTVKIITNLNWQWAWIKNLLLYYRFIPRNVRRFLKLPFWPNFTCFRVFERFFLISSWHFSLLYFHILVDSFFVNRLV